jgi:hypothetical protein
MAAITSRMTFTASVRKNERTDSNTQSVSIIPLLIYPVTENIKFQNMSIEII